MQTIIDASGAASIDMPPPELTERRAIVEKSVVRAWAKHCARFRGALPARAVLQILTTSAPFLALVTAMIWISYWSYLAALALAVPAGGLPSPGRSG